MKLVLTYTNGQPAVMTENGEVIDNVQSINVSCQAGQMAYMDVRLVYGTNMSPIAAGPDMSPIAAGPAEHGPFDEPKKALPPNKKLKKVLDEHGPELKKAAHDIMLDKAIAQAVAPTKEPEGKKDPDILEMMDSFLNPHAPEMTPADPEAKITEVKREEPQKEADRWDDI